MGLAAASEPIARNALCPCGSGKKYKQCCLRKEEQQRVTTLSLRLTLETALKLHLEGDLSRAKPLYQQVLDHEPANPDALHLLGVSLEQEGQHGPAADLIGRAIANNANVPEYHRNRGIALRGLGDLAAAADCLRQAVTLRPADSLMHRLLAEVEYQRGDLSAAAEAYRAALLHNPGDSEALRDFGNVVAGQGNHEGAINLYRAALPLAPHDPDLFNNLGQALATVGRLEEAYAAFDTALRLAPGAAAVMEINLAGVQQSLCDWEALDQRWTAIRTAVVTTPRELISPFSFLTIPGTAAEQLTCARNWARNRYTGAEYLGQVRDHAARRGPRERLHVGYVSMDFRDHLVARVFLDLFLRHDRTRFLVSAYSGGRDDGGAMRGRIRSAVDRFVDLRDQSNAAAAQRIQDDAVDILLDLSGYTYHSRLELLALRPAPIQVNCVVYPGTMGTTFHDYIIVDPFLVQPEQRQYYSERLAYLPDSYLPPDATRSPIPVGAMTRAQCGLPDDGFIFCCFNNSYKITPSVFALWLRLLERVPGSTLWLKAENDRAVINLRREALRAGVDPARLVFAPHCPLPEHLARQQLADLFLDTLPFNAHTTATDALWAGLPVLTCAGESFASRVAGSLLHAVGLPELVTHSLDEYEALAVALAQEPGRLAALRDRLAANVAVAPLFDSERYVRNLEELYWKMWNDFCRNPEQPVHDRMPLYARSLPW